MYHGSSSSLFSSGRVAPAPVADVTARSLPATALPVHTQGSTLIGLVVMLLALLLLVTPPLAVLSLSREKPVPVAPSVPMVASQFA